MKPYRQMRLSNMDRDFNNFRRNFPFHYRSDNRTDNFEHHIQRLIGTRYLPTNFSKYSISPQSRSCFWNSIVETDTIMAKGSFSLWLTPTRRHHTWAHRHTLHYTDQRSGFIYATLHTTQIIKTDPRLPTPRPRPTETAQRTFWRLDWQTANWQLEPALAPRWTLYDTMQDRAFSECIRLLKFNSSK